MFIDITEAPLLPPMPAKMLAPLHREVEETYREAVSDTTTTVRCVPVQLDDYYGWELSTETGHGFFLLNAVSGPAELRAATELLAIRCEKGSVAFVVEAY